MNKLLEDDKRKHAVSAFDEKIEEAERAFKFQETVLQKAKDQKAHAEKLWATISHHSEEDMEILRNLLETFLQA